MRKYPLLRTTLAALLAVTAACGDDDSATEPGGNEQLTQAEAEALAVALDDGSWDIANQQQESEMSAMAAGSIGTLAEPITIEDDVTVTAPCPVSGTATWAAHTTVVADSATQSLTVDLDGTRSHSACAFQIQPEGSDSLSITTDGSLEFTAHVGIVNLLPDGDWTMSHNGSFDWSTDDGKSGTCGIDITTTFSFDVEAQSITRAVAGTVCNRTIDRTTTWTDGGAA